VCVLDKDLGRKMDRTPGRFIKHVVLEYCKFFLFFFARFLPFFARFFFFFFFFSSVATCVVSFSLFETLFFFNAISYLFQSDLAKE